MANIAAIRSVGTSIASYLTNAYRASVFPQGIARPECNFNLTSVGGVRAQLIPTSESGVTVPIFLYRIGMNEHLRNAGRLSDPDLTPSPLSIDLHYMLSFWAQSAENEHLALAWTMRQLHQTPVLEGSILSRDAAWAADDVIQLIPEQLSNEDMMRIWDALEPDYRLSLSYIARVVRIDPDQSADHRPVVATRFNLAVPNPEP